MTDQDKGTPLQWRDKTREQAQREAELRGGVIYLDVTGPKTRTLIGSWLLPGPAIGNQQDQQDLGHAIFLALQRDSRAIVSVRYGLMPPECTREHVHDNE